MDSQRHCSLIILEGTIKNLVEFCCKLIQYTYQRTDFQPPTYEALDEGYPERYLEPILEFVEVIWSCADKQLDFETLRCGELSAALLPIKWKRKYQEPGRVIMK